ncbi:MAG: hypothetical protein K2P07_12145, partial [Lachnospiraceae bacterium]|nr:hypothetical protein [Lachnospiraceae bacterium]
GGTIGIVFIYPTLKKYFIKKEDKKGTRGRKEEIITAQPADNHLMDSYSKTGNYCKLNENLTYQRK